MGNARSARRFLERYHFVVVSHVCLVRREGVHVAPVHVRRDIVPLRIVTAMRGGQHVPIGDERRAALSGIPLGTIAIVRAPIVEDHAEVTPRAGRSLSADDALLDDFDSRDSDSRDCVCVCVCIRDSSSSSSSFFRAGGLVRGGALLGAPFVAVAPTNVVAVAVLRLPAASVADARNSSRREGIEKVAVIVAVILLVPLAESAEVSSAADAAIAGVDAGRGRDLSGKEEEEREKEEERYDRRRRCGRRDHSVLRNVALSLARRRRPFLWNAHSRKKKKKRQRSPSFLLPSQKTTERRRGGHFRCVEVSHGTNKPTQQLHFLLLHSPVPSCTIIA
mmetsp:Transcript_38128/g.113959  ORF Transcript_38128/g.113959 Transcript_38128/m.113959 type:complete len:334 (+) Transcript_38128:1417-2418(+)